MQQGQVFPTKSNQSGGTQLWGYRYRTGGRGSRRVQRGGFGSEQDARESLERALDRVRRANGTGTTLTLAALVDEYLAQHDAQPETIEKLRWLFVKDGKRVRQRAFGSAPFAGDRSLADDDCGRAPLRSDPGASASAEPRCRMENDRRQPGQARRRQPAAAAHRKAAVRVMGATRQGHLPARGP